MYLDASCSLGFRRGGITLAAQLALESFGGEVGVSLKEFEQGVFVQNRRI